MYLNRLSDGEKVAFYSLSCIVASAHDGISALEKVIIDAALHEMNINQPQVVLPLAEAIARFENDESKKIALLELMLVANIDESFDEAEKQVMDTVLKSFGYDDGHIERAAAWAESMTALFRSGQRFIEYA